jgi:hypothetical protein
VDWVAWHEGYADPTSRIARRLPVVQAHIRVFLDHCDAAEIRVISFCSGTGSDLLPVLADHPAQVRVRARLVEFDPELAERARTTASELKLRGVEVVTGDASVTDSFAGIVPADLVLACGVFGNIPNSDVERTVRAMPQLCAERATVIWTRHRGEPDLTPAIRSWFREAGFVELAFDSPGLGSYAVGSNRLSAKPQPLQRGIRLFTFTRQS